MSGDQAHWRRWRPPASNELNGNHLLGHDLGRIEQVDALETVGVAAALVRLYAANVACALIAGLYVALPVTGAAFVVAVSASYLTVAGCDTPTMVDSLIPVVALGSWAATAAYVGVRQIRTLRAAVRSRTSLRLRVR